ncbi:MAG: MFS transporter [Pseudomonadota bacterium]
MSKNKLDENFFSKIFRLFQPFFEYKILAILFLGFSAGIPLAITGSTLSMWLSRAGIDVKTIGLFALVTIPFSFKYLWSPIFDNVKIPYFSRRFGLRKTWLILTQICLMIAICALGQSSPLNNIKLTATLALLVAFFSASQDIVIDAFRIESIEREKQAISASMYTYGYRIAMLVSGAGSLLLADYIAWPIVFIVMSLSILIGIIATIFIKEPKISNKHLNKLPNFSKLLRSSIKTLLTKDFLFLIIYIIIFAYFLRAISTKFSLSNVALSFIGASILVLTIYFYKEKVKNIFPDSILDFVTRPQWIYILLFIIFYKFSDTMLESLKSKFYVDTGFSNSEIAYITKGFGFIMTMVGLFVGGIVFYKLKTFKSLLLAGILQIASNLVFLWIAETHHNLLALTTAIAVENFTGSINTVVIIAYLSGLCNINYTATQYALLSSFSNVGRTIMVAPAGYIVHSYGWTMFIWITAIVGIPALILLYILKNNIIKSESSNVSR